MQFYRIANRQFTTTKNKDNTGLPNRTCFSSWWIMLYNCPPCNQRSVKFVQCVTVARFNNNHIFSRGFDCSAWTLYCKIYSTIQDDMVVNQNPMKAGSLSYDQHELSNALTIIHIFKSSELHNKPDYCNQVQDSPIRIRIEMSRNERYESRRHKLSRKLMFYTESIWHKYWAKLQCILQYW